MDERLYNALGELLGLLQEYGDDRGFPQYADTEALQRDLRITAATTTGIIDSMVAEDSSRIYLDLKDLRRAVAGIYMHVARMLDGLELRLAAVRRKAGKASAGMQNNLSYLQILEQRLATVATRVWPRTHLWER